MNNAQIITYQPKYRQNFIDLNKEWLQKYFVVEPHDVHVFNNIEEVFFCKCNDEIVGTAAMQKIDEQSFELVKMAVTEAFQGKGFSNLLMQACIDFAKGKSISKIVIVSNRSLKTAINLYKKFGFVEVPLDTTDYSRANIQMELIL